MSQAPAFHSSHYRAQGMKPVYHWGLVVWLTPAQYQTCQEIAPGYLVDATVQQISEQDAWYEQSVLERKGELERWKRVFARFKSE